MEVVDVNPRKDGYGTYLMNMMDSHIDDVDCELLSPGILLAFYISAELFGYGSKTVFICFLFWYFYVFLVSIHVLFKQQLSPSCGMISDPICFISQTWYFDPSHLKQRVLSEAGKKPQLGCRQLLGLNRLKH